MGCLFGCFRTKDNHHRSHAHNVSNSIQSNTRAPLVSQNRLSSLFLSEEEKEEFVVKERENLVRRSGWSDIDDRELKDEAKFLKACGAIPETPPEIRKASKKLKDSPLNDVNSERSQFHPSLPNTSASKLPEKDKQPDESSFLNRFTEECATGTGPEWNSSPSSCVINEQSDISISINSPDSRDVSSADSAINLQVNGTSHIAISSMSAGSSVVKTQRKSVRFEGGSVHSEISPENAGQILEKLELAGSRRLLKPSPCPTPLKLTDDMQTPGTVFASNPEYHLANGNMARIRSQYVHTVLNLPNNLSRQNMLNEDGIIMQQASVTDREDHGHQGNGARKTEVHSWGISVNEEQKSDLSLSTWLQPPRSCRGDNENQGAAYGGKTNSRRTHGDRPILGMVAAHWKEDEEFPRISPKGCGGNGIPNSTTKYKEDQKVNWHATPFEERLEKALSEEGIICQRPINGTPMDFEERENDTAASKFQSSSSPKPVISF
ncbi:hypothetical protein Nepgr_014353 [Nepenthes gracilis]|uniref:Protein JASON-like n=1 Tax=Nepenthes gracilis TaxID=150966 RepID=A0AAD3SL20_NEPGR|nr:hypothetical protein Nepgr_014353 [Nepenthes gracilis]